MSDIVTSETVTEEVQPETQVKFLKPRDVFIENRLSVRLPVYGKVQAVTN